MSADLALVPARCSSGAGGQSEAATPGSKNAIAQSILKGCQILSCQVLLRVPRRRSSTHGIPDFSLKKCFTALPVGPVKVINQNPKIQQRRNPSGSGVDCCIADQGCCGAPAKLKKGLPFTSPEELGRSPTAPLIRSDSLNQIDWFTRSDRFQEFHQKFLLIGCQLQVLVAS